MLRSLAWLSLGAVCGCNHDAIGVPDASSFLDGGSADARGLDDLGSRECPTLHLQFGAIAAVTGLPRAVQAADLDEDGVPDVVVAGATLQVFFSDGHGGFRRTPQYARSA